MSVPLKTRQTPSLHPLSFSSEPIVDLAAFYNDRTSLVDMIHDQHQQKQHAHHKLTKARPRPPHVTNSPAVTFTSDNSLAVPPQHTQGQAQSDCGHGSPQRSHSLLRRFSLRSRNSLSLRKSRHRHQNQEAPLSLPSAPSSSAATTSKPKSGSTSSPSSSDVNSSSSIWKKWRVRSVTEHGSQEGVISDYDRDTTMTASVRKRKFFLPFVTVSRLVAPFEIPSSSSSSLEESGSSVDVMPRPQPPTQSVSPSYDLDHHNVIILQDEDDVKVNENGDVDAGVELKLDESKPTNRAAPPVPSLPVNSSTGANSSYGCDTNTDPKDVDTEKSSCASGDALGLPTTTINVSLPVPSPSNPTPNLKLSLSQKRRAKFTLGDESDLDCDLLAVSASVSEAGAAAAAGGSTVSNSNTGSVRIQRSALARRGALIHGTRDQVDTTCSSSTDTASTAGTSTKSTRRWTLSSAMTDESISDEGLIKELERMREVLEWDCSSPNDMNEHDPLFTPSPSSHLHPSPTWLITQRALLTTRELILTERHYLSSILLLLCPDSTLTSVPEKMMPHVRELVGVSEKLLRGMEEEPSVRGVAEVFVEVGDMGGQVDGGGGKGMESAFVGWCGVVGGWFQDKLTGSADLQAVVGVKRKRKIFETVSGGIGVGGEHHSRTETEGSNFALSTTNSSPPSSTTAGSFSSAHAHASPLMRTVTTWRMSMPSISGLGGEGGVWRRDRDKDKDEGDSAYGHGHSGRMSPTSFPCGAIGSSSIAMPSTNNKKPIRKPTVRDLAILPTQRVMRYVLLYRDLLANTPPSSSAYPLVERAVEVACGIAEKCDRAQGNAAFIAGGGSHLVGSSAAISGGLFSGSSSSVFINNSNNGRRRGSKRLTLPEPSLKRKPVSTTHTTTGSTTWLNSNSISGSPTKSNFPSATSAPASLSRASSKIPSTSLPPSPPSSKPKSSPIKNQLLTIPLSPPPPPPPSSFHSKIPIAKSATSAGSSFTTTTTTSPSNSSSSSPSSSLSPSSTTSTVSTPLLCPTSSLSLPKSASSTSTSSRMPKSLSGVSLMSLVNGLGRSVSGPSTATTDSGLGRGYIVSASSPTTIQV